MAFNQQHWYRRDGSSAHGATLREARKEFLLPSVTSIEKVIAAPQLTDWMVQQALDAALTLPRLTDESLDQFKVRALDDSRRQAREAAAKGGELHDALEAGFTGRWIPVELCRHYDAVNAALIDKFGPQPWVCEASFAHPLGFGGRCDLHAPGIVVDFKSKPRIEEGKRYAYDNHARQLAAYAVGLGLGDDWQNLTLANLFIGVEDAKVSVHVWTPAAAVKGWKQFRAALQLWQALNNYSGAFDRQESP